MRCRIKEERSKQGLHTNNKALSLFQPNNNYRQWIRVEFHVSLLGHALSAVDLCDAARQVTPDVLQVHRLHAVWVVRTATHGRRWVRIVAGERGGGGENRGRK